MKLVIYDLFLEASKANVISLYENASASLVWDGSHCLFVEDWCSENEMRKFFEENRDSILEAGLIKGYYETGNSRTAIEAISGLCEIKSYKRKIYKGNIESIISALDPGLVTTQEVLHTNYGYEHIDELKSEIVGTWGSVRNYERYGFGICMLDKNVIQGWCLSEYNAIDRCGIGIETIEEYQGNGIGKALVNGFMKLCKEKNVIPLWDSWGWNTASVKLAESSGFEEIEEYDTYIIKPL
jgi:GNAT superfamily N-acetyltransferase